MSNSEQPTVSGKVDIPITSLPVGRQSIEVMGTPLDCQQAGVARSRQSLEKPEIASRPYCAKQVNKAVYVPSPGRIVAKLEVSGFRPISG